MDYEKFMKYKPRILVKTAIGVLILLLLIYIAFFKKDALRLETLKVGGPENMQLVTQLYKSDGYKQQQAATIQQILASMQGTENVQPDTTVQPTVDGTTLDADTLASIKEGTYVEGDEDARITIFEYSEMLCPYCKRQKEGQVLEQVMERYDGEVNVIFKHYIVHPQAKILSEAAECVGAERGSKKFYEFILQSFSLTDTSEAGILTLAKSLGVKESSFTKCLSDGTYSAAIDATTQEWRAIFGVTGTPGNVIVDNENGTFHLVAGAYPVEEFVKIIDEMLK